MLEIGKTHAMTHRVTPETTASALKSGSLAVLATPVSRCLTFSVEASDSAGFIGRGSHQRFIVDGARFQAKCDRKRDQ